MPALAITDQSNLYATIKFYQAARQAGIKPIIGADVWIHLETEPEQRQEKIQTLPKRLTLLCQNNMGYQNLIELISKSYLQRKYHPEPRIKKSWLQIHNRLFKIKKINIHKCHTRFIE